MKTQTLKFTPELQESGPIRSHLEFETPEDLEWGLDCQCPELYVVKELDQFVRPAFEDLTVNRGKQNKATELGRILLGLGKDKVPIMESKYQSGGKLMNAIRKFLDRAQDRGENRVFVIATRENIFDQLWEKAGTSAEGETRFGYAYQRTGQEQDESQEEFQNSESLSGGLDEVGDLIDPIPEPPDLRKRYIGNSREIRQVRQLILRAAEVDFPVLIVGPSGTGKELVARQIHQNSRRNAHRCMTINCGAITPDLFESEIFGHKKGAFTGAHEDKVGLWKLADKGTLFLDEIGDLSSNHQVKILRALDEGKIRPVGATKHDLVNVRIMAATNRDLFTMVQTGQFREDLYYRLKGILIRTPALKDHKEDIPLLSQKSWKRITKDVSDNPLSKAVIDAIESYHWQGNVRELKNILGNVYALFGTKKIEPKHLIAVINYETRWTGLDRDTQMGKDTGPYLVDRLTFLKRINETLYATKTTMDSAARMKKMNEETGAFLEESLRFQLDELEILSRSSLLVANENAFFKVHDLTGKIRYLVNMISHNAGEAIKYWHQQVAKKIETTLSCLSKDYNRLVDSA